MADPAARLLQLLSLLQARRDWSGADLAGRLAVSPRTVRRDVDRLRGLGYPVTAGRGPEASYRLAPGADLPPLRFDDQQAVALVVALQSLATDGAGLAEAAGRALSTVTQVLPAHLRTRVEALHVTPVAAASPSGEVVVDPDVLLAIGAAVRAHEVLRFDHRRPSTGTGAEGAAADDPTSRRRVEPHHLATWDGRWYLVAWDLDRRAWRTFRVDRMHPVTNTGPRFTPRSLPGGDVGTFLARRFQGLDRSGHWPCRGSAVIDLPATQVVPFARDGVVTALDPDRCRLDLGSWSWIALASDLGRFDAPFDVLGPPQLRAACATLAERHAAAISPTPGGRPQEAAGAVWR